jgi:murein DD-endopeptidase MepM/ murein hydrolase activator NlpD
MALGSVLAIPLLAVVLGYTTVSKSVDRARLERLERQNRFLAAELDRTHNMVAALTDTMNVIVRQDRRVRLLAGLEPTDPEVQLAGIGGPSAALSEVEAEMASEPLGRGALDAREDVSTLMRRANLLARSFAEVEDSLEAHVDRATRTPSIWPVRGWLTSRFLASRIHPIHGRALPHEGIDISAAHGTEIIAPAGGLVVDAGRVPGYGLMVTIDHGYRHVTRYAHCDKILVRVGQKIRRGDKIALVGNTGISTGPHLHYEVIVNGQHHDPRDYIFPESVVD